MQRGRSKTRKKAYYSYINNIIEVNEDQDEKPAKQKRFFGPILDPYEKTTQEIRHLKTRVVSSMLQRTRPTS